MPHFSLHACQLSYVYSECFLNQVDRSTAEGRSEVFAQSEALTKARSSVSEAKTLWQEVIQTRLQPPASVQQAASDSLKALLQAAVAALEQEHAALRSREATNTRMLTARCNLCSLLPLSHTLQT